MTMPVTGSRVFSVGRAALALLCAVSVSATADPRGEALSGAARCRSIADDRAFLNCIYGAMQPLRAELGLPPALPAQTRLVPPATAMVPGAPERSVGRVPPPRGEGLLGGVFGSGKVEVSPQRMTDFRFDRNGFFTVTLAGGAVWKQLDGDGARAHWHGNPANLVATVRGGAFGAHVLQVRGEAATYKVIRVR
jgi:hypothetical protein